MKAQMQKGFTLIELMIVVAIIGILAAVALPAYSDYQAKSKVTAGLAEIAGGKTAYELAKNEGTTPTTQAAVGLAESTQNCKITVNAAGIECEVKNAPTQVTGGKINLNRNSTTGVWKCKVDTKIGDKYKPTGCES